MKEDGTPVTADRFALALGGMAERLSALSDTIARSVSSISGLTYSFQSASRSVVGLGSAIALLAPGGKLAGIGIAGIGGAGVLAGGAAAAGMGLAAAASPNGLQSVDKAFEILAGTVGGLLLPGFVILGGVALTAADGLRDWLKAHKTNVIENWINVIDVAAKSVKAFGDWFDKWIAGKEQPKGEGRADAFDVFGAVNALAEQEEAGERLHREIKKGNERRQLLVDLGGGDLEKGIQFKKNLGLDHEGLVRDRIGFQNDRLNGMIPGRGQAAGQGGPGGDPQDWGLFGRAAAAAAGGGKDFLGRALDNADKVLNDMAVSVGKPGITDPASKWKEVAVAISQSELENRKLAMQKEQLQLSRDVVAELKKWNAGGGGGPAGPVARVGP